MSGNQTAIILAAGRSRRMGCSKSLLPLGGKTVLQQVLTALQAAEPARIIIVLGPTGQPVAESLADFPATIVWNQAPQSEMSDSLRATLPALPPEEHGVMICLGDQPLITAATYRRLTSEQRSHPELIIQPQFGGRKGHPVLLPSSLLREISDRSTLRDLLGGHASRLRRLEVDDPGILMDLDTPADYRRMLDLWADR